MSEPTLLDVFAAIAMHALLREEPSADPKELAEVSFEIARAMLRESIEHGQSH